MEETRIKLILGARRCLIEAGHQEFSVRKAARCAGINHGMVHHLFGSKENLVLAVLEYEVKSVVEGQENQDAGPDSPPDVDRRRKMLVEHLMHDNDHIVLLLEMLSLSTEMPGVKKWMLEHLHTRRKTLSHMLGIHDPGATTLLMAMVLGLHLLRALDPEAPIEAAVERLSEVGKLLVTGESGR